MIFQFVLNLIQSNILEYGSHLKPILIDLKENSLSDFTTEYIKFIVTPDVYSFSHYLVLKKVTK